MSTMRVLVLALVLAASSPALAVRPGEQLPDEAQEARARRLSAELRCLVCQNQSIDDSDASLAVDLRRLVRERILAGDNDQAIRTFLVARYGEFVLLKPRFSLQTLVLWGLPGVALVLGAGAAFRLFRRRQAVAEVGGEDEPDTPATLSTAEQEELDRLLAGKPRG